MLPRSPAVFNGKKLAIHGSGFGNSPIVTINGADVSVFIVRGSDTSVILKGKTDKLNLRSGDNIVQVTGANNLKSSVFVLTL